jgi:hypothetical protein
MNKYQPKKVNNFLPDIPINVDSKDKLFSLASSHNLSELEEFITTDSISLNVKNDKNQSIMHVLLEGDSPTDEEELLRCIKFLVERGAPISSIDNSNLTPLFICIKKKYSKIFKFLLEKGASLDINTNDDLTVLHEIAKPEHTTYDEKGIQDLIPEKVPKITMEGYEQVYKDIIDAIQDKLNDNTLDLSIFQNIAKQFYYHDEREDFNNVLLLEEASSNPNIKNELFKKLKNQLKDFYTSDRIDNVNIQELTNKLTNITNQLNNEFAQNKMHQYNDNVLNAIKSIAYSLELSTHFFYNERLENSTKIIQGLDQTSLRFNNILHQQINFILLFFNEALAAPATVLIPLLPPNPNTFGNQFANALRGQQTPGMPRSQEIVSLIRALQQIPQRPLGGPAQLQLNANHFYTLTQVLSDQLPERIKKTLDPNININIAQNINIILSRLNNSLNILDRTGQRVGTILVNELINNQINNLSQELNLLIRALQRTPIRLTLNHFYTLAKLFISNDAINGSLEPIKVLPDQFKNDPYDNLRDSYKLNNIPNLILDQVNNNIQFNHINDIIILNIEFTRYIDTNTQANRPLALYFFYNRLQNYVIDYFNLLHTFNEYARNSYINPINPVNIQDPFQLYQNIQQIYKYNYIIYIFEKEREKILNLKNYNHNNIELKKHLDNLFDTTFKELENSVNLIKQQLKKIEKLSNDYIDIYNKINGNKIYTNANTIYIGIYPKIQFPTEIKYTVDDEDLIINNINPKPVPLNHNYNYEVYNKHKNDFFHNFVLYFQDIGIFNGGANNLLNNIPINYNIDINTHNTNDDNNKNKAYKLYFYDPTYLKLEKQNIITTLLNNQQISDIPIPKFSNYNTTIVDKLKNEIKNKILNEVLEEQFNNILVLEINNFFKEKLSRNTQELTYETQIKEPDFNAILLTSAGFSNILIPNYEFKNNKFLSISKNKFLDLTLYFDTNYFKPTILSTLKYYKKNNFIKELLDKNKSLLLKTDIKGWTPIYYAIDGNNYEVIYQIIKNTEIDTLIHYDHKKISPLRLCINKQLNHLNYLLTEDNKIHYLNNYVRMLKNDLKSNNILIPLNIESVFIIALFIQNHIWLQNASRINLTDIKDLKNTRRTQINKEYNNVKKSDVDNNVFKFNDNDVKKNNKREIKYTIKENTNYNNINDNNDILQKYNALARNLESDDFGLYGSYWKNYDKNNDKNNNIKNILEHINESIRLKTILKKYKEEEDVKFNLPKYNISELKKDLQDVKPKLERYLKFINIRFNSNKDNAYNVFLNKIYVHVLANIIGVDYYLKMEELIVKHYMNLNIIIDQTQDGNDNSNIIKEQLKNLNKLLINNKLDDSNVNYKYISATKNPELALKKDIIDILNNELIPNNEELINTFETKVYPNYRDLYKITFKHLQMFISNYHKFIYNQYHGLEILLLLLDNISS